MTVVRLGDLLPIVQSFVGTFEVGSMENESVRLAEIGVDSLTTVNIIVDAAEKFGLNLERLGENTDAPKTMGDVLALLNRLGV